jgi:hypothetical protein
MTLESVSRSLSTLKNTRVIALVGIDAVSILDQKKLRHIAKSDEPSGVNRPRCWKPKT